MNIFEDKGIIATSIDSLGEFGLIDHLTKDFKINNPSSILGVLENTIIQII